MALGAVKVTLAEALPLVAVPIVGAPGGPVGVALAEALEEGLVPALFVAVTVNVYAVPLVKPLTPMGLALPVPTLPPGLAVTV